MKKRFNKKGQDLSIGTLILIVLGIIVLVLLILGFSMGWDNLWKKINIFRGGSSVGDVATACKLSANSEDKYSYCQDFKKVKDANGDEEYLNCQDTRIEQSLDKKLTCAAPYDTLANSRAKFCETLTDPKEKAKKVNGVQCPTTKTCIANEAKCVIILESNKENCKNGCNWIANECKGDNDFCKDKTEADCTGNCKWA